MFGPPLNWSVLSFYVLEWEKLGRNGLQNVSHTSVPRFANAIKHPLNLSLFLVDHVHVDLVGPLPPTLPISSYNGRPYHLEDRIGSSGVNIGSGGSGAFVNLGCMFQPPFGHHLLQKTNTFSELWSTIADGLGDKIHHATAYIPQAF